MSAPTFRPTAEILAAVIALLRAVTWTNPATLAEEPAFPTVKPFVGTDLNKALQALLTTQTRAAYVVFDRTTWEHEIGGDSVRSRRSSLLWVVVTDRAIGDYMSALYGTAVLGEGIRNPNTAPTPGALGLADLLVEPLTGQLLVNPQGVRLLPESEEPTLVEVDQNQMSGRAAVAVQFRAQGGWFEKDLTYYGPTT